MEEAEKMDWQTRRMNESLFEDIPIGKTWRKQNLFSYLKTKQKTKPTESHRNGRRIFFYCSFPFFHTDTQMSHSFVVLVSQSEMILLHRRFPLIVQPNKTKNPHTHTKTKTCFSLVTSGLRIETFDDYVFHFFLWGSLRNAAWKFYFFLLLPPVTSDPGPRSIGSDWFGISWSLLQ